MRPFIFEIYSKKPKTLIDFFVEVLEWDSSGEFAYPEKGEFALRIKDLTLSSDVKGFLLELKSDISLEGLKQKIEFFNYKSNQKFSLQGDTIEGPDGHKFHLVTH